MDLMVKLVEYIQAMDKILNPIHRPDNGTGTSTGHSPDGVQLKPIHLKSTTLEKNEKGYPILPDPIPSDGWKKSTWESLYLDYLGQHYHLAC